LTSRYFSFNDVGMALEIDVLGALRLRSGEADVPVRSGSPRKVLVALALARGVCTTDALVDLLWPVDAARPKHAGNALQTLISHLRKALVATGARIETTAAGYRLVGDVVLDARRFEAEVQEATAAAIADPATRVLALDAALRHWRGPAFTDFRYDDFVQPEIVRLEELRLVALERRGDALLEDGRHVELVGLLRQLVAEHPLRETLRGQLMVALYRSGRQTEALAVYRELRDLLLEDAGLDPTPMLQDLQVRILQQDPALAGTPRPRTGCAARPRRRRRPPSRPGPPAPTAPPGSAPAAGGGRSTRPVRREVASAVDDVAGRRSPGGQLLLEVRPVDAQDAALGPAVEGPLVEDHRDALGLAVHVRRQHLGDPGGHPTLVLDGLASPELDRHDRHGIPPRGSGRSRVAPYAAPVQGAVRTIRPCLTGTRTMWSTGSSRSGSGSAPTSMRAARP
jgi:DNA-binding SARP family transcriptional activator